MSDWMDYMSTQPSVGNTPSILTVYTGGEREERERKGFEYIAPQGP